MKLDYTLDGIESRRDKIYRRTPELALQTRQQTLKFIEKVGFCLLYGSGAESLEIPCIWNAVAGMRDPIDPSRRHGEPQHEFVTDLRGVLPSGRTVFYGKVLQGRPTAVSLELLPYFLALVQRVGGKDEYMSEYRHGRLTPVAKEIMEVLSESSPVETKGLKLAVVGRARSRSSAFEKAMNELQSRMFIVNVANTYEAAAPAWETVYKAFGRQLRRARALSADEAREEIIHKYFQSQIVSSVQSIHRTFGWRKQTIFKALGGLMEKGKISANVKVDGRNSKFYAYID